MKSIDYIYRFDPQDAVVKAPPATPEIARHELENGNQTFSNWMLSCQSRTASPGKNRYVIECSGLNFGHAETKNVPHQDPFAIVIGCSDARVPIEMIFGQGFNELFVVRVAGNVLADECWGSIDYAIQELAKTVKLVVVLGHSGCGAVTAAVDTYLNPTKYGLETTSYAVRSILRHLFVSVHQAAEALRAVWGASAKTKPEYRSALIEIAVCLNAAAAAHSIQLMNDRTRRADVRVVYGIYDLLTHRVSMPPAGFQLPKQEPCVNLVDAPKDACEFDSLAREMAARLKSRAAKK